MPPVALGLVLALSSLGCGDYWPVRWPRSDLWTHHRSVRPPIQLSQGGAAIALGRIQKDDVEVVVELMDAFQTKEAFHADFVGSGIQPMHVLIHNGSDHPYRFRKAEVDARYLPAASVARRVYIHPGEIVADLVKWVAWFIPGFVFESVVEPATTLDFPGIEEAARRPPTPDNQSIKADFMKHEIADAEIGPNGSLEGVMFIRPPKLGGVLRVKLLNARTQQPLVFELPTPPPVYTQGRLYSHPYEKVWDAVLTAISGVRGWRVLASDKPKGLISVRKGVKLLGWTRAVQMTVAVEKIDDRLTQVKLEMPLPRSTTATYGTYSPSIEKFFQALDRLLPGKPPPSQAKPTPQLAPEARDVLPSASPGAGGAIDNNQ